MPITTVGSNPTAATHFRRSTNTTYAYRRFGSKPRRPLLFPEHFTGHARQLGLGRDRPLASGRDLILFDNAGVGRSTGNIPRTVARAAAQALDFLDWAVGHLRRPGLLAWWNDCSANATRAPVNVSQDDAGRHRATRRR
jgi:pimeloyl-ACP methyl ester carboxylesterase